MFRENAKPNFVERSRGESPESLLLERGLLMNPCITSRAKLFERFAICIGEMKCIRDMNRAMVFGRRRDGAELSGFAVKFRHATVGFVVPQTGGWRHESNAVVPVTIVETRNTGCRVVRMIQCELGRESCVDKRISVGWTFE